MIVELLGSVVVANEKQEQQGFDPVELDFELVFDSDEHDVANFIVVIHFGYFCRCTISSF